MKVAGYNLGCKVNKYELDAILLDFQKNDFEIVDFDDVSDVYIITTCAVTTLAEKKSRKYINRTKRLNPNAITVALGCYIQKEMDSDDKLDTKELLRNVDIFIGTEEKSKVREYVMNEINRRKSDSISKLIVDHSVANLNVYEDLLVDKQVDITRAYVKIQDGCNNFCSYCIIPYVRGRERSRSLESIIHEVTKLASNGVKEVVLVGIEIAAYGKDLKNVDLCDVIRKIAKIDGIERIRLSSLEQSIIDEKFINMCKDVNKLCHHFHLSLQSGCDTVLKRMNRKYTTEVYYEKIKMLRDSMSDVSITTDIIVGFPEETEDEFSETLEFVKKVGFSNIHIFPYSIRTGTRAAKMPQLSNDIKQDRAKCLNYVNTELNKIYLNKFINTNVEVLIEQLVEPGVYKGHTSNFIAVLVKSDKDIVNQFVTVKCLEQKGNEMIAEF